MRLMVLKVRHLRRTFAAKRAILADNTDTLAVRTR
jgi:hypothetical protein